MKFLKNIKNVSIATIIVSVVVGILFIAFPEQSMEYTALILGASLIGVGAFAIISYFVKRPSVLTLTLGVIVAICGIIICFQYKAIISFIMIVFGVFILASGVVDLITGIRAAFMIKAAGIVTVILSIVTIAFGILAITKSFDLSVGIVKLIGVALIIYAVLDTVAFFEVRKIVGNAKTNINNASDIETQGTVVEEADE